MAKAMCLPLIAEKHAPGLRAGFGSLGRNKTYGKRKSLHYLFGGCAAIGREKDPHKGKQPGMDPCLFPCGLIGKHEMRT